MSGGAPTPKPLALLERRFPVDPVGLLPAVTADNAPFWEGLARRELLLQRCADCGNDRHPIAPVCPYCGRSRWSWKPHDGQGRIFSWVRYHKSYLPEFEDLIPYIVVIVALDDGPRMTGLLVAPHVLHGKGETFKAEPVPAVGDRVRAVVERWPEGRHVLAFAPD